MKKREILKEIESKGFNKSLWNKAGKCMHQYDMLNDGDTVVVGVSGGKDSLTLLNLFIRIQMIADINFKIIPLMVTKSEKKLPQDLTEYIDYLSLKLEMIEFDIEKIVFDEKNEKNPCALCSRLRRGVIYSYMNENGYTKLALGHHMDDLVETFLLNLFFQGSSFTMRPKYRAGKYSIDVMRPLSFVEEKTITKYAKKISLPTFPNNCIFSNSKDSKRKRVKEILLGLEKENPSIRKTILNAIL